MDALRDELYEYFGTMNDISKGIYVENPPQKPNPLLYFEQSKMLGALPNAGGLFDQPYITMMTFAICKEVSDVFERLKKPVVQQESK